MMPVLNFALILGVQSLVMRGRFLSGLWKRTLVITAVIAMVVLSFHHLGGPKLSERSEMEITVSNSHGHSHGQQGSTTGMEEHSHPHALLPAAYDHSPLGRQAPWSARSEPKIREQVTRLLRPPRTTVL